MNTGDAIDLSQMAVHITARLAVPLLPSDSVPGPVIYQGRFWEVSAGDEVYHLVTDPDRTTVLDEHNRKVALLRGLRDRATHGRGGVG